MRKVELVFGAVLMLVFLMSAFPQGMHAYDGTIVDLNAGVNARANPVWLYLDSGTYDVQPVGVEEGGLYNAWNAWGSVNAGQGRGWFNRYGLSSLELGEMTTGFNGVYATAREALAHARAITFTLSQPNWVAFFTTETQNLDNNQGGMSLRVSPGPACAIVNIAAQVRPLNTPKYALFPAGRYRATPIGKAEGGIFTAWNPWGRVDLANGKGWINGYMVHSREWGEVKTPTSGVYRSAAEALRNAKPLAFELADADWIGFSTTGKAANAQNDLGGMSFRVCRTDLGWDSQSVGEWDDGFVSDAQAANRAFQLHAELPQPYNYSAAVFDADGDGVDDLVLAGGGNYHVALSRIQTDNTHRFAVSTYSTRPPGATGRNLTTGLGLHDYDNDGVLDLYLAKIGNADGDPNPAGSTLMNDGRGRFSPIDLGINSLGCVRTVLFADFDLDGYTDSYHSISAYWHASFHGNQLHPGTADWRRFEPDIIYDVLPDPGFWYNAAGRAVGDFKATVIRDFDNDGKPDIITGAYADITPFYEPAPYHQKNWNRGIFVLQNVSEPSLIRFEDVSNQAIYHAYSKGTAYPQMHVYSILPADFDRDGDLDLFVTGTNNPTAHLAQETNAPIMRFYRNDSSPGRIKFANITQQAGLDFMNTYTPYVKRSLLLAAGAAVDIDNDGDVDVVNVNKKNPGPGVPEYCFVWRNNGDLTFELIPKEEHGMFGIAREMSFGDFNDDGRIDIVVVDGAEGGYYGGRAGNDTRVYFNNSKDDNHFIKISVAYPENKTGIGTKVTVFESGTSNILGYDEVRTDFCYRSKKSNRLHFGLGDVTRVDVKVQIPGDPTPTMHWGLAADREHTLSP